MGAPAIKENMKFDVEVVKGPHQGLKLSFQQASITIGRGPENDVVLANDPRVSRQHAEIKQRGQEFVVVNLTQKNFVVVNGSSIQTETITNDSVILIGDCEIRMKADVPKAVMPKVQSAAPPAAVPKATPQPMPSQMPGISGRPQMPMNPPLGSVPPAPMGHGYMAQPQGQMAPPPSLAPAGLTLSNPKVRFYAIVAVVGLLAWWLLSPSKKDLKDPNAFRTSDLAMADVREAEKNAQELLTLKREKLDTIQYRRAQENFIRGFRDFQQGQYARAREAFQVVLNLDPENELAKRYFHLSKIKFDEMVKFNMIQGNRYREKRNWRMCQASYSVVMTMLQNRREDPTFKEAKQFFEQCSLNSEGRF